MLINFSVDADGGCTPNLAATHQEGATERSRHVAVLTFSRVFLFFIVLLHVFPALLLLLGGIFGCEIREHEQHSPSVIMGRASVGLTHCELGARFVFALPFPLHFAAKQRAKVSENI